MSSSAQTLPNYVQVDFQSNQKQLNTSIRHGGFACLTSQSS